MSVFGVFALFGVVFKGTPKGKQRFFFLGGVHGKIGRTLVKWVGFVSVSGSVIVLGWVHGENHLFGAGWLVSS